MIFRLVLSLLIFFFWINLSSWTKNIFYEEPKNRFEKIINKITKIEFHINLYLVQIYNSFFVSKQEKSFKFDWPKDCKIYFWKEWTEKNLKNRESLDC